jgi:hypothetical protein
MNRGRMNGLILVLATVPAIVAASAAQLPKMHGLPSASPQQEKKARAVVIHADYRFDDILWENDRTAHRIYGRALEAAEPPSTSGIDAWGKNVREPFMDRQLRTGDQHTNHGEGVDFYNVNTGRGAGGLGIWQDNKLWTSRNYARYEILRSGMDVASFRVEYDPWPVGIGRQVSEARTFTLPTGTSFTRMVSTIRSDRPGPLVVGIGIGKRPTGDRLGQLTTDKITGRMSWWGPDDPAHGTMAVAVMVDPAMVVGYAQDFENYLVLVRVTPGKPFVYYTGAAWSRGLDIHTKSDWDGYVASQTPDFDPAR